MADVVVTDRGEGGVVEERSAGSKRRTGLGFAPNAERVLRARYLKKDEEGHCIESPKDLFRRVAKAIADPERIYDPDPEVRSEWEDRFYDLMVSRRFMPNSPTLMNAGREMGMLSACFVLPVGDSIDEIFDSIKHTALIQKAGGGTGFAFDELRPTGDYIRSSGGTTSGPISFWRAFSEATNAIQQGAFRRGANMGMMYIDHPDILKFLYAKEDLTQFTNYNISVKIPDAWMEGFLAEPDAPHVVRNPRTDKKYLLPRDLDIQTYDIKSLITVEPTVTCHNAKETQEEQASQNLEENQDNRANAALIRRKTAEERGVEVYSRRDIWNVVITNAHRTGEPGVAFMDRINQANPTPHIGRMEATNPCGEQPLLPYEACNLGSINLAAFVVEGPGGAPTVDWAGLRVTIEESIRFLDNVIDANRYPLPQIDAICKANRKIGLGIMGFADALFKLGVGYNSEKGIEWGERFMAFVQEESHRYDEQLAGERGSFPNWEGSIYDTQHHRPMRNATCTTVAPTGTISIIVGCSGGIEPLYSLAFFRNVLRGQDEGKAPMIETNAIFETVARQRGFLGEEMMEQIATEGTLANISNVPDDVRRIFVCAHDIAPDWHMRMQAGFQKHCDSSISKTINFPKTATVDDVEKIYRLAYELDCKGVTVYRNECRSHQPMALKSSDKSAKSSDDAPVAEGINAQRRLIPAILPEITTGIRVRQLTPFGNMHINITLDPKSEREMEVFAQLGKGGDLANSDLEAICRMISLWLRSGGELQLVIRQLRGIGSSLQVHTKEGKIMSLGDGLARALAKYMRAKTQFGLKALILGDYSLEALTQPAASPNNGNGHGNTRPNGAGQGGAVGSESSSEPGAGRLSSSGASRVDLRGIQWQQAQFKVVCPECQGALRYSEGCETCDACGYAKC